MVKFASPRNSRGQSDFDRLADRVRAVEADPTDPYAKSTLSKEIGFIRDRQKRILSKQDLSLINQETALRQATLEHPAYAKGFADGRADALRTEYGHTHETVRDRHAAYDAARADLEAQCARLADPILSEALDRLLVAAARVFQAEAALRDVVVEGATPRSPRHIFTPTKSAEKT